MLLKFLYSKILSHSSTKIKGIFLFSVITLIANEKSPSDDILTKFLVV